MIENKNKFITFETKLLTLFSPSQIRYFSHTLKTALENISFKGEKYLQIHELFVIT